ncbi:MAG: hypothetical protein IT385_04420 [Deltaproteobacteria bacterium]|nr:hypothetical protein [Deltaproteobacteria bacterium]
MKFALSILACLALAPTAMAEEPALTEGELHVTMKNAEYVKVQVNGEEWENIEFEAKGKKVLIKGLQATLERNAVTLLPQADSGLAPLDVEVLQKDFKKKRVGRVLYLVATKTVGFTKAPTTPPPAPDAPPKQPDVAPPPPEKDDL